MKRNAHTDESRCPILANCLSTATALTVLDLSIAAASCIWTGSAAMALAYLVPAITLWAGIGAAVLFRLDRLYKFFAASAAISVLAAIISALLAILTHSVLADRMSVSAIEWAAILGLIAMLERRREKRDQ